MVAMDYAAHRVALETLYEDRATVKRYVDDEKPSKETVQVLATVYTDQPCRISRKSLGQNSQTEAQNDIKYETTLFIAPDLVIQQGDVIAITRVGSVRTYTAGEPFLYASHQEISLQREGYA